MATSSEQSRSQRPQPQRMGPDPLRPLRYGFSGIKGLIGGFFDGMAKFGRKGFWAGLAVGLITILAAPEIIGGLGGVLMFGVAGLAIAGSIGAIGGSIAGGIGNVARSRRREKYADELAERQTARSARQSRSPGPDFSSDSYAERQNAANYNFERSLQQDRENDRDYMTFWQDRVSQSNGNGNGRGH